MNFKRLIAQTVEMLRLAATRRNVTLESDGLGTGEIVLANWNHTMQALTMIIRVLIDTVPEGTCIYLRTGEVGDHNTVKIESSDSVGTVRAVYEMMHPSDVSREGFRTRPSRELDLFMARKLVELCGGQLWLGSTSACADVLTLAYPRLSAGRRKTALTHIAN
jgi:hypothetical protein